MVKDDGGQAFPVPSETQGHWADPATCRQWVPHTGMSLRDYFAGQALAGLLANPGGPIQSNGMNGWAFTNCDHVDVAALVYRVADAMLEARKR